MEKILILYSNPADTDRIRLDKEHRAIDQVLAARDLPPDTVVRRHATTFHDLTTALAEAEFSIFHFSGHGSSDGIYLEGKSDELGELVTAERIAAILSKAQPHLKAAIFMCCFSADAIHELIRAGPYLLTVFGPADDEAAIKFVHEFYKRYLEDGSINKACFFAEARTRSELQVVLSRRADNLPDSRVLFEVFPNGNYLGDSYLVDLNEAQSDIERLDVPRETFLYILSRKIRLHERIFNSPRERAFLPVGQYVGVFSWYNSADLIRCHRVLKMKPEIEQEACDVWPSLTLSYNDHAMQRYRLQEQPGAPHNYRVLEAALRSYQSSYELLCNNKKYVTVLPKYVSEQYRLTKSVMSANLEMAQLKRHAEDFGAMVFHLESVLSALHDLLDALTAVLTLN